MTTSATSIHFDDVTMWVELTDGRTIGVPMAWFPRLLHAAPDQRAQYRISATGKGLHWEAGWTGRRDRVSSRRGLMNNAPTARFRATSGSTHGDCVLMVVPAEERR